jgi:hypothetical protein
MTQSFWIHSFLKEYHASPPNPSTIHTRETLHYGLGGSHISEQVQREINDVDMDLFLVAYVSGFIARRVLRAVRCGGCKTYLTSPVMLSTIPFIYFKEYKDDKQSLTYPFYRLVETAVASVTVLDGMMADVHTHTHTHTHIQLKRKLQLSSRTPLMLDGFSLMVRFTTKG